MTIATSSRTRTSSALALALLAVLAVAWAAPAIAQDAGELSGQFLVGVRSVDVGGREAKYREDINLDDGPRLFDLDFHFVPGTEMRSFADQVELDVNNLGGDPFETIHLGVQKFGAYNFRYDRRKSDYFYEDVILPPELANVRLSSGGDFHHFDFQRVRDTARFDVDATKRAKLNFGFERFTKVGDSTITGDIQREEYELDKPIDESLNQYNGGFQYAWDKVTLVLQETYRDYKNAVEIFAPGQTFGENTTNADRLDFFFLDQPYDYTANTHTARILAHPTSKLSIQVGASMQSLDLDVSAAERSGGLTFSGAPYTTDVSGAGTIDRDIDLYDLDVTYSVTDRVSVTGGFYSKELDQKGSFLFGSQANTGRWKIETTGVEAGVLVAVSPELTLSGGVRSESRDVTFGGAENDTIDLEKETTDNTGFYATLGWRPVKDFRLNASYETNSYDEPFALASPTDRERVRLRGQYDLENGFYVAGTYSFSSLENTNSGWTSDFDQADLRFGYHRPGLNATVGYGNVSIDHDILQAVNDGTIGPFDIAYRADSDFIDGQLRWTVAECWTLGGTLRRYNNDGSFALQRDDYSGFVEYAFDAGYLVHVGYRTVDYDEDAYNFDDYDADIYEFAVGYRW